VTHYHGLPLSSLANAAKVLAGRQLNCKVGQLSRLAATYGCGVDDLLDVPSGKVVDPDGLVV
jgi:hypothetical protein